MNYPLRLFRFLLCASVLLIYSALNAQSRGVFASGGSDKQILPENFRQESGIIAFTENKGQVRDQNDQARPDVLYGASDGNMSVHIRNNGVSYQLNRIDTPEKAIFPELEKARGGKASSITLYRIDINWLGCNPHFTQKQDQALSGFSNYYLTHCPQGILDVRSYKGLHLENVYDQIDLHYYTDAGHIKYDFIVAPGGNYKHIQLEVKGADIESRPDGSLLLKTPLGNVEEGAPLVYQNGRLLNARWKISHQNVLSFEIDNYNPLYPLRIDPLVREWATYYGGSSDDHGRSCKTDAAGNVYMTGLTASGTGIASTGAYKTVLSGSTYDAYLVKFDNRGFRLWGTYYGGNGDDRGFSCSIDPWGNIYMSGLTTSVGSIASSGAYQTAMLGFQNAFLVKFNSSGSRIWATYYGVLQEDGLYCCTDRSGNVYMAGSTYSFSGIASPGAYQTTSSGSTEAFLVKFDTSGNRLWATYYGGSGEDYGYSCCTDTSGNVYMSGRTKSASGVASSGAYKTLLSGSVDAYLVKFDSSGGRLWATYYGGSDDEIGWSCCTDRSGNVYMTGSTNSFSGIASPGAYQTTNAGTNEVFLVKFDNSGSRLWATYYGGEEIDEGRFCIADVSGNIYVTGISHSGSGIASSGAYQTILNGTGDAYLVKFDSDGRRLWGTYYGGDDHEVGWSSCIDVSGNIYMAGFTYSGSDITTSGAHQTIIGGYTDAFLLKFNDCAITAPLVITLVDYCQDAPASPLTATGTSLKWYTVPTGGTGTLTAPTPGTATAGITDYYVSQTNSAGCESSRAKITVQVNTTPVPVVVSPVNYCQGATSAPLTATPTSSTDTLKWYTVPTGGTGTLTAPTPGTAIAGITDYYVSEAGACGEGSRVKISVQVSIAPVPTVVSPVNYCQGATSAPLTAIPTSSTDTLKWYTVSTGGIGSLTAPMPNTSVVSATDYYVGQASACGEGPRSKIRVQINALPSVPILSPIDSRFCEGTHIMLYANAGPEAKSYRWIRNGVLLSDTTPNIVASTAGLYEVTVLDTYKCSATSGKVTLKVDPLPPKPIINKLGMVLSTTLPYYSYLWYRNGRLIPGAIYRNYTLTFDGDYFVEVTDSEGCTNVSEILSVRSLSVKKLPEEVPIGIYPNPSQSIVYISSPVPLNLKVQDIQGKCIEKIDQVKQVDMTSYADGVYIFSLFNEEGMLLKKDKVLKQTIR